MVSPRPIATICTVLAAPWSGDIGQTKSPGNTNMLAQATDKARQQPGNQCQGEHGNDSAADDVHGQPGVVSLPEQQAAKGPSGHQIAAHGSHRHTAEIAAQDPGGGNILESHQRG